MREDLQIHLEPRSPGRVRTGHAEGRGEVWGRRHRLSRLAQACGALFLLLLLALEAHAGTPRVVVLSWDGIRFDYIERAPTPALDRMRREGVEAERLVPVFPSSTFPSHVSLATGAFPDRHGIVGNVFRDPERGIFRYSDEADWLEAEPIWVAAERQGLRTATFFWVGSDTDWHGVGATYRRTPFDEAVPESEKVDQILAWLDLPEEEAPSLILSWWHGCDGVGHKWGPEDRRVAEQLERQDRELARLFDGLDQRSAWSDTTLMLVSDHGMVEADRAIDLKSVLAKGGVEAAVVNGGGMAHIYLQRYSERSRALEILGDLPAVRAYAAELLPLRLRAYHPSRTGHIVVLAEPPHLFEKRRRGWDRFKVGTWRFLRGPTGAHGFDPELPEMGAVFLALGRGVPAGERIGPQRAVDVAPTVARLLGIDPPRHAEGRPIPGIGPAPRERAAE
jgi:predicted AlkP superfamily pyrophosphatase or phosphodiesterase